MLSHVHVKEPLVIDCFGMLYKLAILAGHAMHMHIDLERLVDQVAYKLLHYDNIDTEGNGRNFKYMYGLYIKLGIDF